MINCFILIICDSQPINFLKIVKFLKIWLENSLGLRRCLRHTAADSVPREKFSIEGSQDGKGGILPLSIASFVIHFYFLYIFF